MPKEELLALAADVDRLLAAGAPAAIGHDGLRRRARTLRDLGRKVPSLNPVAEAIDRITEAEPERAGPALLDLLVLTRQIRGSLSTAGPVGELQPLRPSGPWRTPLMPRDLHPVLEALGRSGPGRKRGLRGALDRKAIADLRLVPAFLQALEDGSRKLAGLVIQEVLPAFGPAIVAELRARLNFKGKPADARRLAAICRIDPLAGAALCRQALAEGRVPLRIQALQCLPEVGEPKEVEQLGLEHYQEKNRAIQAAAVAALRTGTTDAALEALVAALADQEYSKNKRAVASLIALRHPQTTPRLVRELQSVLAALPDPSPAGKNGGQKAPAPAAADRRLQHAFRLMEVLGKRADDQRAAAADALVLLARQPRGALRQAARKALRAIGRLIGMLGRRVDDQRAATVAPLVPLAPQPRDALRQAALKALGVIGPATPQVVPTLMEAVADESRAIAGAALKALEQLPPAQREAAVPLLLQLTQKTGFDLHGGALGLLADHAGGRFRGPILDVQRKALLLERGPLPRAAIRALGKIGPAAGALVPDVLRVLKEDGFFAYGNEPVLARMEPQGTGVLPELIACLGDPRPAARAGALRELAAYGPKARDALPQVRQLLEDPNQYVRDCAERTLMVIQ